MGLPVSNTTNSKVTKTSVLAWCRAFSIGPACFRGANFLGGNVLGAFFLGAMFFWGVSHAMAQSKAGSQPKVVMASSLMVISKPVAQMQSNVQTKSNVQTQSIAATQLSLNVESVVKIKADLADFTDTDTARFYPRIVGGQISENNYPWMVSLQRVLLNGRSNHLCGGSFIDERWVLTAAHCVVGAAPNNFRIIANTNQLDNPNASAFNVKAIHIHEDYNPQTLMHDIALIELFEAVDGQGVIEPANEDYMTNVIENDTVTVSGWGALAQGNPILPNDLYEVDLPVRAQEQCLNAYPNEPSILSGMTLCAGIDEGGIDSCQGDSGGPLFQADGVGFQQVGIVSWGAGCAQPGQYGVYTRVASYAQWIESFVNGLFLEGPEFIGYVGVNTAVSRNAFIRNAGDDPVEVNSIILSGLNAASFALDASDCIESPIPPDQTCTLVMTAAADEPGPLTATINANLNSPITPELTVQISAMGVPFLNEGSVALDTEDALVFSGQNDAAWFAEADALAEGNQSLMSGKVNNNQLSVATAVIEGPGTVSFAYRVSSEENFDVFVALHNGDTFVEASGEVDYTEVTRTLLPGQNHLTFGYVKDVSISAGEDAAWVDNMVVVLETEEEPPVSSPVGEEEMEVPDEEAPIALEEHLENDNVDEADNFVATDEPIAREEAVEVIQPEGLVEDDDAGASVSLVQILVLLGLLLSRQWHRRQLVLKRSL